MSAQDGIVTYTHCAKCSKEKPANQSLSEWSRIDAGLTATGIQIWCKRCRKQIAHFTPAQLSEFLARGPACSCCPGGLHRS